MSKPKKTTDIADHWINPPQWQWDDGSWVVGRRLLAEVEELSESLRRKWGDDRMRSLCPRKLREAFDSQEYKLRAAVRCGDLEGLREQCGRMLKALRAADEAASKAPSAYDPEIWEVGTSDGKLLAVVRSVPAMRRVDARRYHSVWSLEEFVKVIEAQPEAVLAVKQRFEGSEIGGMFSRVPIDQLPTFDPLVGDDIPF
jgi:hypothetical protein